MSGTDGDGYQSAWRADRARDIPTGDPWAAPMSCSPGADASTAVASATGAAVPPEPSTSEHPTAPWPFVTSHAAFPDIGSPPADDFPDAADAPSTPWPDDVGETMPAAVWPPTDRPHESAPGVWTSPSPFPSSQPAWSQESPPAPPPAWPQQSAPPSWPPLPDTSADKGTASIVEQHAPSSEVPPVPESASAVSGATGWAYATEMAAPGVYVPGAPPPWPEQHPGSAASSESRASSGSPASSGASVWPPSAASGTTGDARGGGFADAGTGRSRRRGAVAVVVLIAVVVASVVGVAIGTRSHGHVQARTASAAGLSAGSPGSVPSGSPSAASTVGSVPLGDGHALVRRIVPPPAGAHVYDVEDSSAGVMDVEQYARHYFNGDATELKRLRKEGFQVAASTDYVRSDGIEIATHLVQFTDVTGAEDYFDVEKSAWSANDRVTAGFEVPATRDAVGYELSTVDSLGNRRSVMYEHVGNVVVVVNIYTSHTIDRAVDIKVLQAQLVRLG